MPKSTWTSRECWPLVAVAGATLGLLLGGGAGGGGAATGQETAFPCDPQATETTGCAAATDTVATDTAPTDTVPTDTVPAQTVPTETVPTSTTPMPTSTTTTPTATTPKPTTTWKPPPKTTTSTTSKPPPMISYWIQDDPPPAPPPPAIPPSAALMPAADLRALLPATPQARYVVPPGVDAENADLAYAIASANWPASLCQGFEQTSLVSHAKLRAEAGWGPPEPGEPLLTALAFDDGCRVLLNSDAPWTPVRLCMLAMHEFGHLAGRRHSSNPDDVMAPIVRRAPACEERWGPADPIETVHPAPGFEGDVAVFSSSRSANAKAKKAKKKKKKRKLTKAQLRARAKARARARARARTLTAKKRAASRR